MASSKGQAMAHGHSHGPFGHGGHHQKGGVYGKQSSGTHAQDHLNEGLHNVNLKPHSTGPGGMDM